MHDPEKELEIPELAEIQNFCYVELWLFQGFFFFPPFKSQRTLKSKFPCSKEVGFPSLWAGM